MLNINLGYNEAIINHCTALKEYSTFVSKVKYYLAQKLPIEKAADRAVDDCIAQNIMKDYLLQKKAGVIMMCLEEYNFEKHMEIVAKDIDGLKAVIADKDSVIASKNAEIADKDAALADKDAQIAELMKLLAESKK